MTEILVFDVDDTVVRHEGDVNYADPRSLLQAQRRERVCQQIRALHGFRIVFVSHRADRFRSLTRDQLTWATGIASPEAYCTGTGTWQGWTHYVQAKADVLRRLATRGVYIGDRGEDRLVAAEAGWRFIDVADFEDMGLLAGEPAQAIDPGMDEGLRDPGVDEGLRDPMPTEVIP